MIKKCQEMQVNLTQSCLFCVLTSAELLCHAWQQAGSRNPWRTWGVSSGERWCGKLVDISRFCCSACNWHNWRHCKSENKLLVEIKLLRESQPQWAQYDTFVTYLLAMLQSISPSAGQMLHDVSCGVSLWSVVCGWPFWLPPGDSFCPPHLYASFWKHPHANHCVKVQQWGLHGIILIYCTEKNPNEGQLGEEDFSCSFPLLNFVWNHI